MRYVVLIVGILGSFSAGYLGYRWRQDAKTFDPLIRQLVPIARLDEKARGDLRNYERTIQASCFLLAAVPMGILASAFAFLRYRFSGAILLLLAVLGPTSLNPSTLVFTFGLVLAAFLCLFIRRPRVAT